MTQKVILCYGDSNTWGFVPCAYEGYLLKRYSYQQRWTGILQGLFSEEFQIIEEGLNGRTTNLDYQIPPDRNGKKYLPPCLYSHAPIDLVILALGGNDLKTYFNRSAEDIRNGLAELIDIIQISPYGPELKSPPKIMIVPPPIPLPIAETYRDENGELFLADAISKSKALVCLYSELAEQKNCYFLDISKSVIPSEIDGVHYDDTAHKKLGKLLYEKLQTIL